MYRIVSRAKPWHVALHAYSAFAVFAVVARSTKLIGLFCVARKSTCMNIGPVLFLIGPSSYFYIDATLLILIQRLNDQFDISQNCLPLHRVYDPSAMVNEFATSSSKYLMQNFIRVRHDQGGIAKKNRPAWSFSRSHWPQTLWKVSPSVTLFCSMLFHLVQR